MIDVTNAPGRASWVESANEDGADFPIQNLPYGVFSRSGGARRIGCAIGDRIFDLSAAEDDGLIAPSRRGRVFASGVLNPFMALGPEAWARSRDPSPEPSVPSWS